MAEGKEYKNHEYVARVKLDKTTSSGKPMYRYFYTQKEYQKYLDNKSKPTNEKSESSKNPILNFINGGKKAFDNIMSFVGKSSEEKNKIGMDKLNEALVNGAKAVNDLGKIANDYVYGTDPNNKYDMNSNDREEKLKMVAEDKEWKEIVKNKDPEYVKKVQKDDGTYEYKYDIDKYVVNKKHPIIDAMDDLTSGRYIDTYKVTEETRKAAIRDYVVSGVHTVGLYLKVVGSIATAKFKMQAGSYDDEIEAAVQQVEQGKKYIEDSSKQMEDIPVDHIRNAINNENIEDTVKLAAEVARKESQQRRRN
ncbi:MAG: hypothetical protein J6B01_04720 [Ruminococcus sp.]|nr:hypothetical protein [Ruminococcus sp.]